MFFRLHPFPSRFVLSKPLEEDRWKLNMFGIFKIRSMVKRARELVKMNHAAHVVA